jgi:2-C-methyl-D-erythritol 2,4-cyclodiphosphate synthase
VTIDHDHHLVGHSDADVLLHAVTDALLGAAALGDIGELFPDADPANKNRDSAEFLLAAASKVRELGFRIINLDCVVFAERPRLLDYKRRIRDRLGTLLELPSARINVKAKTGEAVGPVGRQEAIAAECIALLAIQDNAGP